MKQTYYLGILGVSATTHRALYFQARFHIDWPAYHKRITNDGKQNAQMIKGAACSIEETKARVLGTYRRMKRA